MFGYYARKSAYGRTSRYSHNGVLFHVTQRPKVLVCRSAEEMLRIRPLWESLYAAGRYTLFQSFDLNLLVAARFAEREGPYVVSVESEQGAAIVPAVLRLSDGTLRLLGEELFDYRAFLHRGDDSVLRHALGMLAELGRPLEIVALRGSERSAVADELELVPFAAAPGVKCEQMSADRFAALHTRLARNLRRMERLGFALKTCNGDNPELLRAIYKGKAQQSGASLFHDAARIELLVSAAAMMPHVFEIFTLEKGETRAAAVVTLRDGDCRRFYTGWFGRECEKHSPALSLIYEVTRQSLAAGLDCDYMTGEQDYKMRLATASEKLFRVRGTTEQMAAFARAKELPAAA